MLLNHTGLFRQQNIKKHEYMSVRKWADLCAKEAFRAPTGEELKLRIVGEQAPLKRQSTRWAAVTEEGPDAVERAHGGMNGIVLKDEEEDCREHLLMKDSEAPDVGAKFDTAHV